MGDVQARDRDDEGARESFEAVCAYKLPLHPSSCILRGSTIDSATGQKESSFTKILALTKFRNEAKVVVTRKVNLQSLAGPGPKTRCLASLTKAFRIKQRQTTASVRAISSGIQRDEICRDINS